MDGLAHPVRSAHLNTHLPTRPTHGLRFRFTPRRPDAAQHFGSAGTVATRGMAITRVPRAASAREQRHRTAPARTTPARQGAGADGGDVRAPADRDAVGANGRATAGHDATGANVRAPARHDAAGAPGRGPVHGGNASANVCASHTGTMPDVAAAVATPDAWAIERLALRLRSASGLFTTRVARTVHGLVWLRAWQFYGFARLTDYAGLHHGRSARWFQDYAKLGEALDRHPILEAAVEGCEGRPLGAVSATEIARIATAETISDWIHRARQVSVRELKEQVRAQRMIGETAPGPDPGPPGALQEAAHADPGNATEASGPGHAASRTTLGEDDPDIEPCVLFGFDVPRKVKRAFEDGLDLHRAVAGGETTVQAFLDALSAESAAGLTPPDCVAEPLQAGDPIARKEHALARITQRWAALYARDATSSDTTGGPEEATMDESPPRTFSDEAPGAGSPPTSDLQRKPRPRGEAFPFWDTAEAFALLHQEVIALERDVHALLAQLEGTSAASECGSSMEEARARHDELRQLLPLEDAIERCLARVLTLMRRRGDFMTLGFASLGHHAVERLGLPRRTAESRAGILHALRRLPRIRAAYESGVIGVTAAWVLYGILGGPPCDPDTQDEWVEHARRITVKRLKEEARALQRQELATPEPSAVASVPRPAGDAEWLEGLRRAPGDTRNRLRAVQLPGVEDASATLADLRRTDVFLRFRLPADIATALRGALEAARRRLTTLGRAYLEALEKEGITGSPRSDAAIVSAAGPPANTDDAVAAERSARLAFPTSLRAALAFLEHERRVPTWAAFLALLEDYAETHDNTDGFPARRWDPVYIRWGWVCRAPGCTVRVGMEDHHIVYRSRNGSDELHNQIVLCAFHHRQGEHGDFMRVWGKSPDGVHWIIGAPGLAAEYFNERQVEAAKEP